jgi:hypothetical protein
MKTNQNQEELSFEQLMELNNLSIEDDGIYIITPERELLPFNSSEFDYIIADLSLHYFSWDTTVKIFENISSIPEVEFNLHGEKYYIPSSNMWIANIRLFNWAYNI